MPDGPHIKVNGYAACRNRESPAPLSDYGAALCSGRARGPLARRGVWQGTDGQRSVHLPDWWLAGDCRHQYQRASARDDVDEVELRRYP